MNDELNKKKIIPHWLLDQLDETQKNEAVYMLYSLNIDIGAVAKHFRKKHPNSGIKARKKIYLTREQKIETLQQLAKKLGRTPTCTDVCNEPLLPSHKTYANTFGGWNNALKAAGLKVLNKTPRKLSVKEKMDRYGHIPTAEEIKKDQHKIYFKEHPEAEQHYKHRHKVRAKRYPLWVKEKNNRCLDCGIMIKPGAKRCESCSAKYNWQIDCPGKTKNYCKDCGKEISQQAIRCNSCGAKHWRHSNDRQKNKKFFCIECGKEVSTNRKRCQSCANKEIWKLYRRQPTG